MKLTLATAALALVGTTGGAHAHAANVTPDIIFGSGNANGSFTIDTGSFGTGTLSGNVEVGLRAKLRFDDQSSCSSLNLSNIGCPQDTFNWDGVDTYTFAPTAGTPTGFSVFNFEWSIYVDASNNGTPLDILDLSNSGAEAKLFIDTDPGAGVSYSSFDPLAGPAYYGDLTTPNGGASQVTGIIDGATVAQQSVNYGFIPGAPLGTGSYNVKLSAFNVPGDEIASSEITINVVPVPGALPLLGLGVAGFAMAARRKKALQAA